MYCRGCGHAIVVGPGGECVECATVQPVRESVGGSRASAVRLRASVTAAGLAAGAVLVVTGAVALAVALAAVATEVLG